MTDRNDVPEKPPMVEVEWLDSSSWGGWHDLEDLHASLDKGHTNIHCRNVGYLFREEDGFVALVSAYNHEGNQAETMFIIPRAVIQSITVLRKGRPHVRK